jgi:hypothetical protein
VQLFDTREWLLLEGYKAECLTATRELDELASLGLLFATKHQLLIPRKRGWLTLIDSTHSSNWLSGTYIQ